MFKFKNLKLSSQNTGSIVLPVALGLMLILSGCATRVQHTHVGAVPDDYRTNHPIVIAEQDHVLDLPVGKYSHKLNLKTGDTIQSFAQNYLKSGSSYLTIMKPTGAGNSPAAASYSTQVLKKLVHFGVPKGQITITPYDAQGYGDSASIRLIYSAISASTHECGKWSEDMLANSSDNKNYENFGCATQNNIAQQIANPLDLLSPRGSSPVDAARRATAIGTYQTDGASLGNL
jgi:pilus assembly protein CpaD